MSLSQNGSVISGSIDSVIDAVKLGHSISILEDEKQISPVDNLQYDFDETTVGAMVIWRIRTEETLVAGSKAVVFTVSNNQFNSKTF